jgi:glutamate/tyrosine decarboxylase-like PLP-dependent enzyme
VGTWAALMKYGRKGYLEKAKQILKAAKEFKEGLSKINGL